MLTARHSLVGGILATGMLCTGADGGDVTNFRQCAFDHANSYASYWLSR